jgi:hypothetical protein
MTAAQFVAKRMECVQLAGAVSGGKRVRWGASLVPSSGRGDSGSKLPHSTRWRDLHARSAIRREAYGVRPACWRCLQGQAGAARFSAFPRTVADFPSAVSPTSQSAGARLDGTRSPSRGPSRLEALRYRLEVAIQRESVAAAASRVLYVSALSCALWAQGPAAPGAFLAGQQFSFWE